MYKTIRRFEYRENFALFDLFKSYCPLKASEAFLKRLDQNSSDKDYMVFCGH